MTGAGTTTEGSEGCTRWVSDTDRQRVVGGGRVGILAGELMAESARAIERGADAVDVGRTIHPHPTLSESVGLAAEVFEGACTDLPPPRRKA